MTFKRWDDYKADFSLEGFPPRSTLIQSGPSFWVLGNLLIGGIIGIVIDIATGGAFSFPNTVEMNMATGMVNDDSPPPAPAVAAPAPLPMSPAVPDALAWERYCHQIWPGQLDQFKACVEHGSPAPAQPATAIPAPSSDPPSEGKEAKCRQLYPSNPPRFEMCMGSK
jgi:hypothetical protein